MFFNMLLEIDIGAFKLTFLLKTRVQKNKKGKEAGFYDRSNATIISCVKLYHNEWFNCFAFTIDMGCPFNF